MDKRRAELPFTSFAQVFVSGTHSQQTYEVGTIIKCYSSGTAGSERLSDSPKTCKYPEAEFEPRAEASEPMLFP